MPSPTRRTPAAATEVPGPLKVGDLLADRYLLLEAVATDGPAVLWRASDEVLARAVAVKVLATPNNIARDSAQPFLDAAVRTGAVNHAGLVRVYDATLEARPGRGNDVAYVISEWVDGEPLDEHLEQVGALAAPDAADVLRQVADALAAAHAGGLTHGRVHPRNVLVTPSGRVRLTDAAVLRPSTGPPCPPWQAATTSGQTPETWRRCCTPSSPVGGQPVPPTSPVGRWPPVRSPTATR